MKQVKIMAIIGVIALAFVFGLTIGEKRVIKNQHIEQNNSEYIVEFDGQLYNYSKE